MPGSLHTNARATALSRFAREDVECLCYKSKVASIFKHFGGACDQRTCSKPCPGLLSSLTLITEHWISRDLLTMKWVSCYCRLTLLMLKSHIGSRVADLCIMADGLYILFIEVVASVELALYALLQLLLFQFLANQLLVFSKSFSM